MREGISPRAFDHITALFEARSGIHLPAAKGALVMSRLRTRLDRLNLDSFDAYCQYLDTAEGKAERDLVVDLLTTNETYFFREPEHFAALRRWIVDHPKRQYLGAWSAACSTGEEAYSLAMTLADASRGVPWQVFGTDLSSRVLAVASEADYPMHRLDAMPPAYLHRYCRRRLEGRTERLRVTPEIRARVWFFRHNLLEDAHSFGHFQVIFLRNVLIYFDALRRRQILERVISRLVPGGLLFLGHSETIQESGLPLVSLGSSIYRRTTARDGLIPPTGEARPPRRAS